MSNVYTKDDCIQGSRQMDYTQQVIVIKPTVLHKSYREKRHQLILATTGFGCDPVSMGTAVFGTSLDNGEQARWSRGDFIGILKPALVEALDPELKARLPK